MPTTTKPVSESTLNKRRAKWVKALTGGRYAQTRDGYLRKRNRVTGKIEYCCLGVACNIYMQETGEGEWVDTGDGFDFRLSPNEGSTTVLPKSVADYFGFRNSNGEFYATKRPSEHPGINSLITANDDFDKDEMGFKGIAKLVQDRTLGIFKAPRREFVKA